MSKIKICGLYRPEDIQYANEVQPDYAGFIMNYPKSHRNVNVEMMRALKKHLDPEIKTVGVFVNENPNLVAAIAAMGIVDVIQLHGQEDDGYIEKLKERIGNPIIKAFQVHSPEDVRLAEASSADYILLDGGMGAGEVFDWSLLKGVNRPFFLAGGLKPENIREAIRDTDPFAIDISSGVETEKKKDLKKMREAVKAAHAR
ncbi:phosphoribosylanthranilate isomerase [Hespellia stercorisuis]|uniref:N-(5'-phosphoribosyl)anthranilate isomerase n=1 Tax=Hespellia stercorisuis DSM 15480 TaxID=1121950 RepID=A0A1M6IHL9_9FIRM|nr:phosphoribosylanthranilate isomerase [Hespellia stercorisuis]SHJ33913.1 phosphoribosylanthranilate isomerase [Hespellia stercorisuis DSM 15480]